MTFYSYGEFENDIKDFAIKLKNEFSPDAIVGVARGGLTLAHCLSVALELRSCFALNSIHYDGDKRLDTINIFNIPDLDGYKKILIVDDIIDSGESMVAIKAAICKRYPDADVKVATIYYKQKALLKPEFTIHEAKDWIEFFWDVNIQS